MKNWKTLAGNGGNKLVLKNNYIIAASLHQVTVWKEDKPLLQHHTDTQQPGFPTLIGDQLYWGTGVLDLAANVRHEIPGMQEAIRTAGGQYRASHGNEYTPSVFAWAPDGSAVAVSVQWTGNPGPPPAKVLLLDKEGRLLQTLWEESNLPVAALYISDKWILAGTPQFRVFDKETFTATIIPEQLPAVRIEMTADEKQLLLLQHDHIGLWDTSTGKEMNRWKGNWNDATITPDGKYIVAVDFEGKPFLISTTAPLEQQQIDAPGAIFSVAADNERLLAFFMHGAVVRITTLL
ncbi:hypothetical protein PV783_32200 [Chitinophaga sp. CC14]|uniref:hypothetical protein n=1 Tax=Chitinophaga sp. CC14 TaxID=3029199 RepID=UPI003B7844F2